MVKPALARYTIQKMVQIIVKNIKPVKIILFGSYARDQVNPDSDIDLLIVMEKVQNKRKKAVEIYQLLAGSGIPKDIIVTTPYEIAKYKNIPGTIFQPAILEGKVLYESKS